MNITLGIDIGTSNSSIAVYDGKDVRALQVNDRIQSVYGGEMSLASAVYVDDMGKLILGQAAYNQRMNCPQNFCSEFKKDFGVPRSVLITNGVFYTAEDFYIAFFRKLKGFGEKEGEIQIAYISHPVEYSDAQLSLLKNAANRAGLFDIELVDEPTAAAVGYLANRSLNTGENLLIYDFGGGTFDASLVQKGEQGTFHQLTASVGLVQCGGTQFDRLIYEDMQQTILNKLPDIRESDLDDVHFSTQLMEFAIKIKHDLSVAESTTQTIVLSLKQRLTYQLSRRRFEEMISPLVEKTIGQLYRLLEQAGLGVGDVQHVLLIGGTCRIPFIRRRLEYMFGVGVVSDDANFELSTAMGAAQLGPVRELEKKRVQEKNNCQPHSDAEHKFKMNGTELVRYTGIGNVVVHEGVTAIGEDAFSSTDITSVVLPEGITAIGESAFTCCLHLEHVNIVDSVTTIGPWAFWGCKCLSSMRIPAGVTSIGEGAFSVCRQLQTIDLTGNHHFVMYEGMLIDKGNHTLLWCSMRDFGCKTVPNGITSIGDHAFASCGGITEVILAKSVTRIGAAAFHYSSGLTKIVIPNRNTSVGEDAFGNCNNLTVYCVRNSVTEQQIRASFTRYSTSPNINYIDSNQYGI